MKPLKYTVFKAIGTFLFPVFSVLAAQAQTAPDSSANNVDTAGFTIYKVDPSRKKAPGTNTMTTTSATTANAAMILPPPPDSDCSITGTSSVTAGSLYTYYLSCSDATLADSWGITCGTIVNWYGDQATVQWNSGCTSGTLRAYSPSLATLATKNVTISGSTALSGGTISTFSQTVSSGSVPAQINATVATGGSCSGYSYQWQSSTDNISFTNISGATGQNYQPGVLFTTTYFKRKTTCGSSTAYTTNTAVVNVYESLYGGYVSNPDQSVNYNTAPAQINATAASGGNCSGNYSYQWQQSTDNVNFTNISGATGQNYQPGPLIVKTYFRRKVTCNGEVTYTETNATISIIRPLNGGCITSGDQTVVFGNLPSAITATPATDGNCGGNYTYQWQSSTDNNYFTDIPGATSQNLSFSSPLAQTTYFQRKTICGPEVQYTGSVVVNMVAYITYYSAEKSGTFTRNNCGTGGTGSAVTYTVAEGAYTSIISQADADAKAQNDVNANGQNYANANGTCTWYNVAKSGSFTKNNCATGGTGSSVTYTVPAGSYSSTISQADADQKAQNDVNANGQTYANNNGYCTWYNDAINDYYYSQNCASGETPLAYYVTVAANTYSSTISKANANAQAEQYAQSLANQNGICQAPDIDLWCDNYADTDFMIELENTTTGEFYYFDSFMGTSDLLGSVPEGDYNITIMPYISGGYYFYSAGCGYYGDGYDPVHFYNVNLNSSCNYLTITL